MTLLMRQTASDAGFDGARGIRMNFPFMKDGGIYRLRRGSTDPRQLDSDCREQLIWYMPEGQDPELWWCNANNEWFLLSFEPMMPVHIAA
jgi:hypothetical protein